MRPLPFFSSEWLRHCLRELIVDRGRVSLVVLGIVWGVLSLTVVLSFGQGLHAAMTRAVRAGGQNILRLYSQTTTLPFSGLPAGRDIRLVPEDALLLQNGVPGVRAVSVEFMSPVDSLEYRGLQINGRTHGVHAAYGQLRSLPPQPGGRFLNERDCAERRRVVFLGSTVKERLFGAAPAVGETIKLWGLPFTVIGVLLPKQAMNNYNGLDDEKLFVPWTTFQTLRGSRYPAYLILGLESPGQDERAIQDIYGVLSARYRFDPADRAALGIANHIAGDRRTLAIIGGTRILIALIGVLGLLVALIGVANVMYVLVEERQREIGIQMALGARPDFLLGGFLLEGLVLTFSGGGLGLLGSLGALWLYNQLPLGEEARGFLGHPQVSIATAALIIAFLATAGCAAGYFPARRAARLNPVAALREE